MSGSDAGASVSRPETAPIRGLNSPQKLTTGELTTAARLISWSR
jgi:hypothetical protein